MGPPPFPRGRQKLVPKTHHPSSTILPRDLPLSSRRMRARLRLVALIVSKTLAERGPQATPLVDEVGDVRSAGLCWPIMSGVWKRGAREHRFPVDRDRFALEDRDVEIRRDRRSGPISGPVGAMIVGELLVVLVGVGKARDQRQRREFQLLDLLFQRPAHDRSRPCAPEVRGTTSAISGREAVANDG